MTTPSDTAERRAAAIRELRDAVDAVEAVPESGHAERLALLSGIRSLGDRALAAAVDDARAGGVTWQAIGEVLEISRQAAFQRFGKPIDPRTGAPMQRTELPDLDVRTRRVFERLAAGEWESAREGFDERMLRELDASLLADVWAQTIALVGAFEGFGEAAERAEGVFAVVDVELRFEAGELVGRVAFGHGGEIAGLFILAPEAAREGRG